MISRGMSREHFLKGTCVKSEVGPIMVIADTHLGLLAGQKFYGIQNDSQCDVLGLAGFVNWLEQRETESVTIVRGKWGDPLEIRKPSHLILLGDYLELWDASDAAIDLSCRSIWNVMEKLTCQKIYLVGNHDFSSSLTPGQFPQGASSIQIFPDTYPPKEEGVAKWLTVGNVNYLFLHGHQFDWTFRRLGKLWVLMSYFRDGAEAFRLWSWILVLAASVALGAFLLSGLIQILTPFSDFFLSIAVSLMVAGALPRILVAAARPVWNKFFVTRYKPMKALKGFADWWKSFIAGSQIPQGQLYVVYGHTHLMGIFNSSKIREATKAELPEQLFLLNIPAWVWDVPLQSEYQEYFRDAFLYVDSSGLHLLAWDWRKRQPFYIPIEVVKKISDGARIDERTANSLAGINWPEKLLSKLTKQI